MSQADGFEARVARVLLGLRPGEVVSYGEVAAEAGTPGAARAVGSLLRRGLPDVPWWRVVRSDGSIASPSPAEQERRLREEGVAVSDGRVHGWRQAGARLPAGNIGVRRHGRQGRPDRGGTRA
jgi:methylated-DNA-protein-cysteine methyltransferase-like protein